MTTTAAPASGATSAQPKRRRRKNADLASSRQLSRGQAILQGVVLAIGALAFLFPFYYMLVGSLQAAPDTTLAGAFPNPSNLTLKNYVNIDARINLWSGLASSGIFTGGVILCTVVFGLLAGYALSILQWRGRGTTFALALLVQVVPFQLLMVPLYVLIARNYGLADNYLGMILPFAINSTAVLIFRQYFLQIPKELFDAARIDGASELAILRRIALPLVRPALVTVLLLTFIGPWNEFLWPFLITKEASMQPLAVSLANYISTVAASTTNPYGAILAGAVVLAAPVVVLFIVFQRYFTSTDIGSSVKG
jgi:ABC-type glycerol-3-phosphate transport system permease component